MCIRAEPRLDQTDRISGAKLAAFRIAWSGIIASEVVPTLPDFGFQFENPPKVRGGVLRVPQVCLADHQSV